MGIRLVLVQFRHRQKHVEQLVHALAGGGAGRDHFGVAAPLAGLQAVLGQLRVDSFEVDARQIDLVQGDDDGDSGGPGVADGLFGLRHHAVVGRHDQHGDVGHVGPASTHRGERFVPGRVDEGDHAAVLLDPVSPDVLRDSALLARDDVDSDDPVQQRGLAVVDVSEEGDDRRAGFEQRGSSSSCSSSGRSCSSRSTWRRKSTSTPSSAARSSAISGSSSALMFKPAEAPSVSSLARTRLADTPIASEKVRMVQGSSMTTLLFRGAAVLVPVRRMRRNAWRPPRVSSESELLRRRVADRFRLSWRCSRPPRGAASASFAGARAPRRGAFGRQRRAGNRLVQFLLAALDRRLLRRLFALLLVLFDVFGKGFLPQSARPNRVRRQLDVRLLRGGLPRLGHRSLGCRQRGQFDRWTGPLRRRCSRLLRRRRLRLGRHDLRSLQRRTQVPPRQHGPRHLGLRHLGFRRHELRRLDLGPRRLLHLRGRSGAATGSSISGTGAGAGSGAWRRRPAGQHRYLARDRAAGAKVILAPDRLSGRRRQGSGALWHQRRGRAGLDRRPGAAGTHVSLDLLDFFVGQAGQRRPLPSDTRLRADVHHRLAIKLQLLG